MKLSHFRPKTFSNRLVQNHLSPTNVDQSPQRKLTPLESIVKSQTSWEKFPPTERIPASFDSGQQSQLQTDLKPYQQQKPKFKEQPVHHVKPGEDWNQLVQRQMSLQRRIAYTRKKIAQKQNLRQQKIQRIKARSGHIIGIASSISIFAVGLYISPIAFVGAAMAYICGRYLVGECIGNIYEAWSNAAFEKEIAGETSTLKTLKEFLASNELEMENLDSVNDECLLKVLPFTENALWLESPISQFLPVLGLQAVKEKDDKA